MLKYSHIPIYIIFTWIILLSSANAFSQLPAPCSTTKSVANLYSNIVISNPRYVAVRRNSLNPSHKSDQGIVLGQTLYSFTAKSSSTINLIRYAPRKYCGYLTKLSFKIYIDNFVVKYDNHYKVGSCPYQVIINHENKHVNIVRKTLLRYSSYIKSELQQFISSNNLMVYSSNPNEISKVINSKIKAKSRELLQKPQRAAMIANQKIDTVKNYNQEHSNCSRW